MLTTHADRLNATIERLYEDLRKSRATIRMLATVATIVNCETCGRPFATRVTKPKRYCCVRCNRIGDKNKLSVGVQHIKHVSDVCGE